MRRGRRRAEGAPGCQGHGSYEVGLQWPFHPWHEVEVGRQQLRIPQLPHISKYTWPHLPFSVPRITSLRD